MITTEDYKTAKSNGISFGALRERVKNGMPVEMAVRLKPNKERSKWLPVAISNDIKEGTFDARVYGLGWSFEDAATKKVGEVWRYGHE